MWWPFKKKKLVGPASPLRASPHSANLEHYAVEQWTPQDGGYAIPPSLTSVPSNHHSRTLSHPIPNGLSLYKPPSRSSTVPPLSPRPVSVYVQPEHNTGSTISLYSQSLPRVPPVLGSQGHNANRQTIPSPLSMTSHQTPTESWHAQSPSQASQSSQSNLIIPLTAPAAPRPRVLQKRSHRTSLVGSSSVQVLSNPGPPRISYEAYKHFQKRYEAAIDEAHEAAREYNGFRPQYQTQDEYKKVAMKYASASHLAQLHYLGRDEHEQHRMFVGKRTDENHEWWREKAKNDWINAYRLAAGWGYNNPHNDPFNPLSTRSWSDAVY